VLARINRLAIFEIICFQFAFPAVSDLVVSCLRLILAPPEQAAMHQAWCNARLESAVLAEMSSDRAPVLGCGMAVPKKGNDMLFCGLCSG
jgi:hypothetical protein